MPKIKPFLFLLLILGLQNTLFAKNPIKALCSFFLGSKAAPQATPAHSPHALAPKNSFNWAPLIARINGTPEANIKFLAMLKNYSGTQTKEFREIMRFINSQAGQKIHIRIFDSEGSSVAEPSKNLIKIYLKQRDPVEITSSDGTTHTETPAYTFFHEFTHLKDFAEQHPSMNPQLGSDIFENPIHQLNRELRANYYAYASNPEVAWRYTEKLYSNRISNIKALIPNIESLDYLTRIKLLDKLSTLHNRDPQAAQDLHAHWWSQKHSQSWNPEVRSRYPSNPGFKIDTLVRKLLAEIAVEDQ